MPIFVILLVVIGGILAIYYIQKLLADPARSLLIGAIALFIVWYLFRVFGLLDVRV